MVSIVGAVSVSSNTSNECGRYKFAGGSQEIDVSAQLCHVDPKRAIHARFLRNEALLLDPGTNAKRRFPGYMLCNWHEAASSADLLFLNRGMHLAKDAEFSSEIDSTLDALSRSHPELGRVVFRTVHASFSNCSTLSDPLDRVAADEQLRTQQSSPLLKRYGWHRFVDTNEAARSIARRHGVSVLNVWPASTMRPGGRRAASPHAFYGGDGRDCAHFCLPGPPDEWIRMLLTFWSAVDLVVERKPLAEYSHGSSVRLPSAGSVLGEAAGASNCSLYDSTQGYRLGDVTGSRWFRHTAGGMAFHLRQFPTSLAASFLRDYSHGTRAYRAYYNNSCWRGACVKVGYCQCYVPRAHSMYDILSRERASDSRSYARLTRTAAVHVRVGDVVDQSPFSVDEMLSRPTKFTKRCNAVDKAHGCLDIAGFVYVQPISRYEVVARRFRELGIEHVVLVAASSVNQSSHAKSCDYVQRMSAFFQTAGFATTYRLGRHPDDDFRFLTRVACMTTAKSGFGLLAAQTAQMFGVEVVMPEGMSLPTFDLTG